MRDIDPQKIENEDLDWFEWKYLKDRSRLPAGYPEPEQPDFEADEAPKSRITPLEEQSQLDFEEDTELEEIDSVSTRVIPLEDQDELEMGNNGGIVEEDDEEEDYEVGWTNDQRRAALSERSLSVDGKKDELIARLRRSDLNELEDDDLSTLDD